MQNDYYTLLNAEALYSLVWVVPLIILFYLWSRYKRNRALKVFAGNTVFVRLGSMISMKKRLLKRLFILFAAVLIVFALSRPAWNPQEILAEQKGRDVVFLLDVSNSMFADDLKPNRLEGAKLAIDEAISSIEGDRVALIAFSGNANIMCPLTVDYSFFKNALDNASPLSVEVGGTQLADALRKALNNLLAGSDSKNKDVIIITDGGDADKADNRFAVEAAREAAEIGVRVITIGIGDEDVGKKIPYTNAQGERVYLQYDGRDIVTRLNAQVLRDMAKATPGGAYVNVGTSAFDLAGIYRSLVGGAEKNDIDSGKVTIYTEGFQYLLILAVLLLIAEYILNESRGKFAGKKGQNNA